jgi:uncharacterized membrane protein YqjE
MRHDYRHHYDERTLSELFNDLSRDARVLVRQEVALAKVELKEKGTQIGKDVAMIAAGGAVAYAGFLFLMATFVITLAQFMPLWLSALIISVVVLLAGILLIQQGQSSLQKRNLTPRQTVDTLKETKEWAQEQLR